MKHSVEMWINWMKSQKTIDMLKWMGGQSCRKAFDLHSMIVLQGAHSPSQELGWIFLPAPAGDVELTSQKIVSREERLIAHIGGVAEGN